MLCENAKAINRDRTSCSFKTVSCAHIASAFNFEIEIKNIVLVALRTFEFSHGLGQKRKCPGSRGTSVLPSATDIVSLPRHVRLVPISDIHEYGDYRGRRDIFYFADLRSNFRIVGFAVLHPNGKSPWVRTEIDAHDRAVRRRSTLPRRNIRTPCRRAPRNRESGPMRSGAVPDRMLSGRPFPSGNSRIASRRRRFRPGG